MQGDHGDPSKNDVCQEVLPLSSRTANMWFRHGADHVLCKIPSPQMHTATGAHHVRGRITLEKLTAKCQLRWA
jgi:hypothetical protein